MPTTYSPAEQARQRAAISPTTQWRREAETWFDGSVDSVDRRLAACDRLLATSREAITYGGVGPGTARHLAAVEDLTAQRRVLAELRHDLITGASDREARDEQYEYVEPTPLRGHDIDYKPYEGDIYQAPSTKQRDHEVAEHLRRFTEGALSLQDRRYVELESAKFIRANSDCSVDELATRARHHAELETSTFPQSRSRAVTAAFVQRTAQLRRAAPRPRVAAAPPRTPDCPDEFMFM
jgi:hypothetical protein